MNLFDPRTPNNFRYVPTAPREEIPQLKTESSLSIRLVTSPEELAAFEAKVSEQKADALAKAS